MGRYFLNFLTLNQVGIRLLPDENVSVAVELEGGLTEEIEQSQATLLLTNKRLIRYSSAGHRTNVVSAALDDIDSIEVVRSEKNPQWMRVGFLFIAGGILLSLVSLMIFSSQWSPFLMALALTLIGVVFLIAYVSGMSGEVIVRAGMKEIKCRMGHKALDDMTLFLQRFYEFKLRHLSGDNTEELPDEDDMPQDDGDLTAIGKESVPAEPDREG
jgi:hypothetical protein